MINKVAIIGCGWLGLPLAKTLLNEGRTVHGSTTSKHKLPLLKMSGIIPYQISISENGVQGDITDFLRGVDCIIINVPPKLRGGSNENFVKKMQWLHKAVRVSSVEKVIFVSSTSVYGNIKGEVTEKTDPQPATESGKQLLTAERIFKNDKERETSIIRFGGLIGPERHPVTMLAKRKNLSNGNMPVNLVHLNDCIRTITEILANDWWSETFNSVYPYHPTKQLYYSSEALLRGLQPPEYESNKNSNGKIVHAHNLINVKGFRFTTTI
ncbi:NAD-dependent epimerase/dehydratase family protein [Pareuzebyella sediminis]|uniref:NAD-dependent epimerase/dehydratase family protein n=1 Tax=Pareuzebyella sediminis TaxID=2607998 RepID=UPI0011EFC95E|nr:NAD(P)H-binding protein [Pareuzebyella sediminis]